MSWVRDQVEFLIDLYKKNELLYDRNNVDYTTKDARTNALALITKRLQKLRPGSTVIEVKLKLWALRTQYNRTITTRRRRGRSSLKPPIIFWAEDKLSFLKPFIEPKIRANKHGDEEQSMEMEEMWLEESFETEIKPDEISQESLFASSHQKIKPTSTNRLTKTLVPTQMITEKKQKSTDSVTVSSDHILVRIAPSQTTAKKKIMSSASVTACSEQVHSKTLQTTSVSSTAQNNEKPFKTEILDQPTAKASDDIEWELFAKFMETEMRSIKCLKRRRRLKRKMLEFIFKAQEEEEDEQ